MGAPSHDVAEVDRPTPPSLAEAQTFHDLVDLYRRHERRIFRLCRAYLMNPADAEDATQETFMRAAGRLGSLSGDVGACKGIQNGVILLCAESYEEFW